MELLAYARIELGLSANEFWECTPAVFAAYSDQKKSQEIKVDYRFGLIAALMRTLWGGEKKPQPMKQFFWNDEKRGKKSGAGVFQRMKAFAEDFKK